MTIHPMTSQWNSSHFDNIYCVLYHIWFPIPCYCRNNIFLPYVKSLLHRISTYSYLTVLNFTSSIYCPNGIQSLKSTSFIQSLENVPWITQSCPALQRACKCSECVTQWLHVCVKRSQVLKTRSTVFAMYFFPYARPQLSQKKNM